MHTAADWHRRFTHQVHWTEEVRAYLLEQADLSDGGSIVEVGCGTGAVLGRLPAGTNTFGLDINPTYLNFAAAHLPHTSLTCGDAHRLPYRSGWFHAACCHFLLLWVADPLKVIAEMARVCRPGGHVLVMAEPDYGGRIDYPEELEPMGKDQMDSLRSQGADPLLGRKLPSLMQAAGLKDVHIGIIGSQWQLPRWGRDQESEWQTMRHDLGNRIEKTRLKEYQDLDQAAWEDGSRVLYVPTFYASGVVS